MTYHYKISIASSKRTLTATYQPKTKEYIIRKINIQPNYCGKLNNLRFYLGYSVSFIIRIMLNWEMQEEGIPVIPLLTRHPLNPEDIEEHEQIQFGNSYSSYNKLNYGNLEVYNMFSCPAA